MKRLIPQKQPFNFIPNLLLLKILKKLKRWTTHGLYTKTHLHRRHGFILEEKKESAAFGKQLTLLLLNKVPGSPEFMAFSNFAGCKN